MTDALRRMGMHIGMDGTCGTAWRTRDERPLDAGRIGKVMR